MAAGRVEENRAEEAAELDPHRGTVSLSRLGQVGASWWERGAVWCKAGRVVPVALPCLPLGAPADPRAPVPRMAPWSADEERDHVWGHVGKSEHTGSVCVFSWASVSEASDGSQGLSPSASPRTKRPPRGVVSGDAQPLSAQTPCAALLWLGALVSVCILIQMLCYL